MAKKLVPSKPGGVSRRSYQAGYGKSLSQQGMGKLGKLKLSTPTLKGQPKKRKEASRDYSKTDNNPINVSFGDTGYTEEDYS